VGGDKGGRGAAGAFVGGIILSIIGWIVMIVAVFFAGYYILPVLVR
jgi:hypothetical protein